MVLRHPHKIRIGDNVVIDDNCLIDAQGRRQSRDHDRQRRVHRPQHDPVVQERRHRARGRREHRVQLRDLLGEPRARSARDTLIAAYCYVIGGDHDFSDPSQPVLAQARRSAGVTIGAGAWLGAGAKILDGVDVGDRAIVGAGAVVRERCRTRDCGRHPGARRRAARRADTGAPPPLRAGEPVKLNVLQVCDHLGWEGSRMHGVKRLFAWMIPRFDPERYNVSLVSLRKKDLSEETLESFGVDITYLHKSKFDPATLPALLKVIDRKQIDMLHLHGYGATTFGRIAGAMRGMPTILHEHANLTDTPWFQKIADTALEPVTDIAIAVSQSTAEFVINARQIPPEQSEGGVSRRAARGVQPRADRRGDSRRPAHELGIAPETFAIGTVTRLHDSKGNSYLVDAAALVLNERPHARFFIVGEGPLRETLEAAGARARISAIDSSSPASRRDVPRRRLGVRHQRVPVTLGGHAADGVRSAGDGQADRGDRCRRTRRRADATNSDAMIVPKRNARALADG